MPSGELLSGLYVTLASLDPLHVVTSVSLAIHIPETLNLS